MTGQSIAQLFVDGRATDQIIAFTGNRAISLARFRRDVAATATRLRALGCRRGLLACSDTYWAAVGLLGLFHAGAGAVMPQNMRPASLSLIGDHWDFVIADTPDETNPRQVTLTAVADDAPAPALPALDPNACRLDLFTSGSTGRPKCVTKTLHLLEIEARAVDRLFGPYLAADSRVHATVSHQHLYGLTFGLIWPLLSGRPFHGFTHQIWETLLSTDISGSILVTSPAHLTRLAGFAPQPPGNRPALILSAGSPLSAASVQETIGILGTEPTEIFGSTETGAIAWRKWYCADPAWTPIPGVRIGQLADGRMSIVSPFLPDDGRHEGADLITLAADGTFRTSGRSDSVVKIEGKRASLPEIETQLRQLPLISAAAVILLAGERPRLAAVVVPTAQGQAQLDAIGAFRFGQMLRRDLAARFESAVLPKHWRFVAALPAGDLGKRRLADLLSLFDEGDKVMQRDRPDEPELRDQRNTEDGIELDLFIPTTLSHLEGHFPDLPIVPGVAQIDWAVKYAARYLKLGNGVAASLQVKFRRLMSPDILVTLVLSHQAERGRISFIYRRQDEILASGSFALGLP